MRSPQPTAPPSAMSRWMTARRTRQAQQSRNGGGGGGVEQDYELGSELGAMSPRVSMGGTELPSVQEVMH